MNAIFKKALYNLSRGYILILGLSICLGVLSTAFLGGLPYLYQHDFLHRLFFWFIAFIPGILMFFCTAPKWHIEYFIYKRKTEYIKMGAAALFLLAGHAYVSSDIFGYLVKIPPNKPYEKNFQVLSTKTQGSKYKYPSLSLDLKAENNEGFYNLVLAKSRFNYTKGQFKATDEILLRGKQNFFGVVVDSIQIKKQHGKLG